MGTPRLVLAVSLLAVVAACTSVAVQQPSHDAGAGGEADAGIDTGTDAFMPPQIVTCNGDAGPPSMPDASCPVMPPGSFGDCATTFGSAFDGTTCYAPTGCVGPGVAGVFDSESACGLACAAAGQCDESKLQGVFPWGMPIEGTFCDDIEVQADITDALLAQLCAIVPELRCEPGPGGSLRCEWHGTDFGHYVSADVAWRVCALSLLPDVKDLFCWVYL